MQNSNNSLLRLAERIYDLDAKVYESLGSSLGRVFNGDRERCINDIVERLRERNEGHTLRSELALIDTAKANGLDYAIDVYPHYGSDVEATLRSGYDILHGLIGPGVYASHNYERSHLDGVKNTLLLLKAYTCK